ncbi:MAG: helix-turn-helix transcriptional regulator [bacterium]|nr:helix-turn-helix transcriptional regulator [bacterium]
MTDNANNKVKDKGGSLPTFNPNTVAAFDIGQRIRMIRKELNLKQQEMADILATSGPSLSDMENCKTRPGHDFFYLIAKKLKVNLYFLLFGEGDMFDKEEEEVPIRIHPDLMGDSDFIDLAYYYHSSRIIRHFLMTQLVEKLTKDEDVVRKEINGELRFDAPALPGDDEPETETVTEP